MTKENYKSGFDFVDMRERSLIKWEDSDGILEGEGGIGNLEWNVWIESNGDPSVVATPLKEFLGTGVRVD